MKENPEVRVRFAPSPTGALHAGAVRTALFDYFLAQKNEGTFMLRIEDTDQARKVEGTEDQIQESLRWLGADWDEYAVQSERLAEYKKFSDELVEKGLARVEENGATRFIVPAQGSVSWVDAIGNREIKFENSDMRRDAEGNTIEGFIILKEDGYPTYHLANVVDDHAMGITHVIRGDDWTPSTPKHILLYKAFGWQPPIFAHVPNVLGSDGKKLSKRRGAKNVLEYREEGYLPEALVNTLMLLGWSPGNNQEIISKEEIIAKFSLDRINVSPAVFNEKKLEDINGIYIRMLDNSELEKRLYDFDPSLSDFDPEIVSKLIEPAKTRMKTLKEFKGLVDPFVGDLPISANAELKKAVFDSFESIQDFSHENILNALKKIKEEKNVSWQDIYSAIIGQPRGLSLPDVFAVIGKDQTLARLS